ncbi:unnamed protein product, partial [Closterium sp. NIES-54]
MMEKFFSFMSFYEQHQQGAPAQSNNSNNIATPISLDASSYARGNQQQRPTFAPYEPQRGSVSFMPHPQPASGQERTLDALQVQSQFAHVLKLQTTKPFDGKDFFTWSFEFELMMEGAQILGFFDGSLPFPTHGTQYDKQQYMYQSMMAYTILLRNITPSQQQNIRSYRGYGNFAELAYNHLKNLYQATESVNQSWLMAQLTTVEMKPARLAASHFNQIRPMQPSLKESRPEKIHGSWTAAVDIICALQDALFITVANNQNLRTRRQGVVQLQSQETNVILQMLK